MSTNTQAQTIESRVEQPNSRCIGYPITSWQSDPDVLDLSIWLTFGDSLYDLWEIDELSFDDKTSIFLVEMTKKDEGKLYAFAYGDNIDGHDIDDVFEKLKNLKVSVSF